MPTPNKTRTRDEVADELAAQLRELMDRTAAADWLPFCKQLVAEFSADPALAIAFRERGFAPVFVRRLERFGRGQLEPRLLFVSSPGAFKAEQLPLSEQINVLENGVEVMDDDETTVRRIPLNELTPSQAWAVGMPLSQQRTRIRDQKRKAVPIVADVDWKRLGKNKAEIRRAGTYSITVLGQIIVAIADKESALELISMLSAVR